MEARFKTTLPQEGTGNGESLPEHNSGSPTVSGGGKISPTSSSSTDEKKEGASGKNLTQQIFHTSMFTNKPRVSNVPIQTAKLPVQEKENVEQRKQTPQTNRKRPRDSPNNSDKVHKQTKYWLSQPIPTSNSFAELSLDEDAEPIQIEKPETVPKPPPIFVDRVENIKPLQELLNENASGGYELRVLSNNRVKIHTKTPEEYRIIVKQLEIKETEFYTYKPKQERSFKVVLKNLHPSTNPEEIKQALKDAGHDATNVWNIKQRATKQPLHMFIVEIAPKSNNKNIYDIQYLLHCRIKFEPPRPVRTIPQCANCQQYGHTKAYCRRKPKCIKCAGDHQSAKCSRKERSDMVKCVLCDGNHPANYKGCNIYKDLQKQKFPPLRNKLPQASKHARNNYAPEPNYTKATQFNSYANILKTGERRRTSPEPELDLYNKNTDQSSDMKQLIEMFKQIMNQMCNMTNLLTNLMTVWSQNSINLK